MSTNTTASGTTTTISMDDGYATFTICSRWLGARSRVHVCRRQHADHQTNVVAVVDRLRPDLGLMDDRVGEVDGVAAGQKPHQVHRKVRVVVLNAHGGLAPMQQAGHAITWR